MTCCRIVISFSCIYTLWELAASPSDSLPPCLLISIILDFSFSSLPKFFCFYRLKCVIKVVFKSLFAYLVSGLQPSMQKNESTRALNSLAANMSEKWEILHFPLKERKNGIRILSRITAILIKHHCNLFIKQRSLCSCKCIKCHKYKPVLTNIHIDSSHGSKGRRQLQCLR